MMQLETPEDIGVRFSDSQALRVFRKAKVTYE